MNSIKLEGSSISDIIDFFETGLNCILVNRGLYAKDDCTKRSVYGVEVLMVNDPFVTSYISRLSDKLRELLEFGLFKSLVVVIKSKETLNTLERWKFDIERICGEVYDPEVAKKQMRAILRQITASVSYLPELEEECTFNVLVYTDDNINIPDAWSDSDANLIEGDQDQLPLSSFRIPLHKVEASVEFSAS